MISIRALHANLAAAGPPYSGFLTAILCHLCGWIERIPGGTQRNDGQETGLGGACGREIGVDRPRQAEARSRNRALAGLDWGTEP